MHCNNICNCLCAVFDDICAVFATQTSTVQHQGMMQVACLLIGSWVDPADPYVNQRCIVFANFPLQEAQQRRMNDTLLPSYLTLDQAPINTTSSVEEEYITAAGNMK